MSSICIVFVTIDQIPACKIRLRHIKIINIIVSFFLFFYSKKFKKTVNLHNNFLMRQNETIERQLYKL